MMDQVADSAVAFADRFKSRTNTVVATVTSLEVVNHLKKKLAQPELTSSSDKFKISSAARRMLFGIPLPLVLQKYPDRQVPPFVEKSCMYIESALVQTQGIFRESGNYTEVESGRAMLDQDPDSSPLWTMSPHVVCDLFKLYVRQLPEPLLTEELYDCFIAKAQVAMQFEGGKMDLANLLKDLPAPNRCLLKRLLQMLQKVASYDKQNLMTVSNLALIFGPNILKSHREADASILRDLPLVSKITIFLISNVDILFKDQLKRNYIGFLRADFDYEANTEGELSMRSGDILWLMERHVSKWWKAELNGRIGFVPETYISEHQFL